MDSHLVVRENDMPGVNDEGNQFLSIINSLAANPDVDVDKLQKIMEMQEHILDRNAEQAFNAAMVQAQKNMPIVPKDKKNTQTNSMYSSYEMMLKHCQPVYTGAGFSILFYEGEAKKDDEIRIMADIMHEAGHTKTRFIDVPIDNVGIKGSVNKTGPHAKGSSTQYGRSYLMKMVFNIPTGDDTDGNRPRQCITEDQANEIESMIRDNNIDPDGTYIDSKFLPWLNVKSIAEIPKGKFKMAIGGLSKLVSDRK